MFVIETDARAAVDLVTLLGMAGAVALALVMIWFGRRVEGELDPDCTVFCGYCGAQRGTRQHSTGIRMYGVTYCDKICYIRAEKREMDERSLDHCG